MRAVGILAGFLATMVFLASFAVRSAHTAQNDPMDTRGVEARIAPITRVAVSGRESTSAGAHEEAATLAAAPVAISAAAASPTVASPASAPGAAGAAGTTGTTGTAGAAALSGQQVYTSTCIACHGAGVAGAPKFGDKAAWAARIGQGAAVLHKHALEGFQGKAGVMPPKGGRVDLPDQSIMSAVDYMVSAAK